MRSTLKGWLGGRGGVVRRVGILLAQLQVVQNEPVAVVGNAQTVWQSWSRAPVYAPLGNNAKFSVPSAASTQ